MTTWALLQKWYMPFVAITVASMIAVPLSMYFEQGMTLRTGQELGLGYGESWALRDDFFASIVVYGLNLTALAWFFSADGSTRWAAFWASLLGFSKVIAPITLANMSAVSVGGSQHYVDWDTLRVIIWFQDAQFFALGLMVWSVFKSFVGEGGPVASHFAHAEA